MRSFSNLVLVTFCLLFEAIGAAPASSRHVNIPTGHWSPPQYPAGSPPRRPTRGQYGAAASEVDFPSRKFVNAPPDWMPPVHTAAVCSEKMPASGPLGGVVRHKYIVVCYPESNLERHLHDERDDLKFYVGIFSPALVLRIAKSPVVSEIRLDTWAEPAWIGEGWTSVNNASWALQRISSPDKLVFDRPNMAPLSSSSLQFNYSFPNPPIEDNHRPMAYVLGSGIDVEHPQLLHIKITEGTIVNSLPSTASPLIDSNGHETAVASIIAGKDVGVAKFTNIFPVKTHETGAPTVSDVIDGVIQARNHFATHARPLGMQGILHLSYIMYSDEVLENVLSSVLEEGLSTVMPAGNNGQDQCNLLLKDVGQFIVNAMSYTDKMWTNAIPVLGMSSNYGYCVDITAPGESVYAAVSFGHGKYGILPRSGTSLAAAYVSGVLALIKYRFGEHPPNPFQDNLILLRLALKGKLKGVRKNTKNLLLQTPRNIAGVTFARLTGPYTGEDEFKC